MMCTILYQYFTLQLEDRLIKYNKFNGYSLIVQHSDLLRPKPKGLGHSKLLFTESFDTFSA